MTYVYIDRLLKSIFANVTFNDSLHEYRLNKQIGKSATSIIKYFYEFNEKQKSYQCYIKGTKNKNYKYAGMSQSSILNEWEMNRNRSATDGSQVHLNLENYIQGKLEPKWRENCNQVVINKTESGISFINEASDYYKFLTPELRMFNARTGICGTADLPCVNEYGKICIGDWKTNEDLFKSFDNLNAPFDYMEASNYNKYRIQLSIYKQIIDECTPFTVDELFIIHLTESTYIYHKVEPIEIEIYEAIKRYK